MNVFVGASTSWSAVSSSSVFVPVLSWSFTELTQSAKAEPPPTTATRKAASTPTAIFLPRLIFFAACEYAGLLREYWLAPAWRAYALLAAEPWLPDVYAGR